jgi:hypothetical protein
LYTDEQDKQLFSSLISSLKRSQQQLQQGRVVLQHLQRLLLAVSSDDVGWTVVQQLLLPVIRQRIDAAAGIAAALAADTSEARFSGFAAAFVPGSNSSMQQQQLSSAAHVSSSSSSTGGRNAGCGNQPASSMQQQQQQQQQQQPGNSAGASSSNADAQASAASAEACAAAAAALVVRLISNWQSPESNALLKGVRALSEQNDAQLLITSTDLVKHIMLALTECTVEQRLYISSMVSDLLIDTAACLMQGLHLNAGLLLMLTFGCEGGMSSSSSSSRSGVAGRDRFSYHVAQAWGSCVQLLAQLGEAECDSNECLPTDRLVASGRFKENACLLPFQ